MRESFRNFSFCAFSNKWLSVSAFLRVTAFQARHRAYAFLEIGDVENVFRIGWYGAALDSVWESFPKWSSSSVALKAIIGESSCFAMSPFSLNNADIIHCGFVFLPSYADASAVPMNVLMQRNTLSTFPTESHFELFRFIKSPIFGEKALHADANRTFWNRVVNIFVGVVNKRGIIEGISQYIEEGVTPL